MNLPEPADAMAFAGADELVDGLGRGPVRGLTRLSGGRNNRVYRVDAGDGSVVLLKCYFSDPRDPRDRLGAEWQFLGHAQTLGVRSAPQPLACDPARGIALYGFIAGRKLTAAELTADHVRAAARFVCAVNRPPRPPFAAASEACFSLADHLATIERRVERLDGLDREAPGAGQAASLIASRLRPLWARTRAQLAADADRAGIALHDRLPDAQCCLSPSDFGFHNALVDAAGAPTFIDFEYAGLDDPAKLVCDFFCQPEIPVPGDHFDAFVADLTAGLGLDEAFSARCRMLRDAYRIKWVCILLNEFLPLDAARRAFAGGGAREARCAAQLAKADTMLAALEAPEPA